MFVHVCVYVCYVSTYIRTYIICVCPPFIHASGVVRQSTSVDSSMLGGSSRLAGIAQLAASVNKTKKMLKTNPAKQTVRSLLQDEYVYCVRLLL